VNTDESSTSSDFVLSRWKLVESGDGYKYLQHEPVTSTRPTHGRLHDDAVEEVDAMIDNSVLVDYDIDFLEESASSNSNIEWSFSIVYSDTYQVPTLYFHVQHQDGSPCIRSQVLQWLQEDTIDESETNSWDFVSQEQHPHTGFPSYFLHPCRTSERMKLLQESFSSRRDDMAGINFLWVWMSMVLPSVNHPIPSKLFGILQDRMRHDEANGTTA
jgi:hypothetical protein